MNFISYLYDMKTCKEPNCNNYCFSKGYCNNHWKKHFGKPIKKRSKKGKIKVELKKQILKDDETFYLFIWNEREHKCQLCNTTLGNYAYNWMFHHLFEKHLFKELRYEKENIILLCLLCHDSIHRGKKYDKIEEIKGELKKKFKIE